MLHFSGETIDLSDPKSYRDLSKPVGIQVERMEKLYRSVSLKSTRFKFIIVVHDETHLHDQGPLRAVV